MSLKTPGPCRRGLKTFSAGKLPALLPHQRKVHVESHVLDGGSLEGPVPPSFGMQIRHAPFFLSPQYCHHGNLDPQLTPPSLLSP